VNEAVDYLTKELIEQCKRIYKVRKWKKPEDPQWWTPELQTQRSELRAFRRRYKNAREEEDWKHKLEQFKIKRALYKRKILKVKRQFWRDFCTRTTEAFGGPYKCVLKKGSPPAPPFQALF